MNLFRFFTSGTKAKARTLPSRRINSTALVLERLEERDVPSTFHVLNLNDSGAGSLRQAILDANAHAGPDTIDFKTTGTIQVTSLPALNDPTGGTKFDGTTAPGYAGVPLVVLRGALPDGVNGLTLSSANNAVLGLGFENFQVGITITGASATGNVIQGNYIGTDGTTAHHNLIGLLIYNASNNRIGTNGDGVNDSRERNVISGNSQGVRIETYAGGKAESNVVAGNYIGTNAAGTAAVGNGSGVVLLNAANNIIGGVTTVLGNAISGNGVGSGVLLYGSGTTENQVRGNRIGTNASASAAIANGTGIDIRKGANRNIIGGTTGARNVISGNSGNGIDLVDSTTTGNQFLGNLIGTNLGGTKAIGNNNGVFINGATGTILGGTAFGSWNLISGNQGAGVVLTGGSQGSQVWGNFIGTQSGGISRLGNAGSGVLVSNSSNNTISGNTIAFNGGHGVHVHVGIHNSILSNSIHDNTGKGIRLDPGANQDQPAPNVSAILNRGTGTLQAAPNSVYIIEVYTSRSTTAGDAEGERLITSFWVKTDANGRAVFTFDASGAAPIQDFLTATATSVVNEIPQNTSEFGPASPVIGI